MKLQMYGVIAPSIDQRSSLRAKRSNLSEKPFARDCFGEDASPGSIPAQGQSRKAAFNWASNDG
jgi:hypothetical protein